MLNVTDYMKGYLIMLIVIYFLAMKRGVKKERIVKKSFLKVIILSVMVFVSGHLNSEKFTVYYSNQENAERFLDYDLLVFDRVSHPDLTLLREDQKTILGYISVGEISNSRRHFKKFRELGLLLQENENWKGSYFVDVRDGRWAKFVIEELIPETLQAGFSGVFLDTIDNPPHLERLDPKKYAGMKQGAINLIKAIRLHYPKLPIMLNRGYDIYPEVANEVDMVLAECLFTGYNFKTKKYHLRPKAEVDYDLTIVKKAWQKNPKLKIYSLDYWEPSDIKNVKEIYKRSRQQNFIPHVSTIELDKLFQEPVE